MEWLSSIRFIGSTGCFPEKDASLCGPSGLEASRHITHMLLVRRTCYCLKADQAYTQRRAEPSS